MMVGWLDEIEHEVRMCVRDGEGITPAVLALRLGISRHAAVYYITMLALRGAMTVERVACGRAHTTERRPRSSPRASSRPVVPNLHYVG